MQSFIWEWDFVVQTLVIAFPLVEADVFANHMVEFIFILNGEFTQTLFLDAANPAFDVGIEVWGHGRQGKRLDSRVLEDGLKPCGEFGVAVVDQILGFQAAVQTHEEIACSLSHPVIRGMEGDSSEDDLAGGLMDKDQDMTWGGTS